MRNDKGKLARICLGSIPTVSEKCSLIASYLNDINKTDKNTLETILYDKDMIKVKHRHRDVLFERARTFYLNILNIKPARHIGNIDWGDIEENVIYYDVDWRHWHYDGRGWRRFRYFDNG